MNNLKVALCFLDEENKPVVIKALKSNWTVELGGDKKVTEQSYRTLIRDEISEVIAHQIRMEIAPDILLEMLEEIGA